MRKINEVLRLRFELKRSHRQIARSIGAASSTVAEYLRRFGEAGLVWPLSASLSEAELEAKLFPPAPSVAAAERAEPDWAALHREMRRPSVTLMLLWQEYRANHPQGFAYSWFCEHYRGWVGRLDLVMRHEHRAGEKLFVDFAGPTMPIIDRDTGELRPASIFVGVLGASNYTYAEATWSQELPEWIGAHVRLFGFLGGVAEILVPDNLKSGVTRAHRYEPEINPTYAELARHYGVAVIPARAARPRDKAKAEAGVQLVERWILARLRNRQFFSLTELNAAIAPLLSALNQRPFKKLPGSRASTFELIDRPALKALPAVPYEYADWKKVRVHIDYHIEFARHYYSVPHALVGKELDARVSTTTVELFHRGVRVASHIHSRRAGGFTTCPEHMPASHREYAKWTPERLREWATSIGPATQCVISAILAARRHPQQGFRSALGVLRLGKHYGNDRLEAVCQRAHKLHITTFKSIESMLKNNLDRVALIEPSASRQLPLLHENIRGPEYYH
jgi:transposase